METTMTGKPMSDEEADERIQKMISFIEEFKEEQFQQIDKSSDEEYQNEILKFSTEQKLEIEKKYQVKEQLVLKRLPMNVFRVMVRCRMDILETKNDIYESVINETFKQLQSSSNDQESYASFLEGDILECLCKLAERNTTVLCRKSDFDLIQKLIPGIVEKFSELMMKPVKVTIDESNNLAEDCAGGVIVMAKCDKFLVDNTLKTRLEVIGRQLTPEIRKALFEEASSICETSLANEVSSVLARVLARMPPD